MSQVECPRCRLRMNAKLHAITSTDAQACPRCQGTDGLEIPMFLVPAPDGRGTSFRVEPDQRLFGEGPGG